MKKNEENNQYSNKLAMMQQYYRERLQVQKEIHDLRYQQQTIQPQIKQSLARSNHLVEEIKTDTLYDDMIISSLNLHGLSFFQLKEKIKETEAHFNENLVNQAIHILEQILIQSKISLQLEQQKGLYVEVLTLCNKYAQKYLNFHQNIYQNQQKSSIDLSLVHLILQKCDVWTHTYGYEPFMRVLTLINLGVLNRKQAKIAQSLENLKEAFAIIQEKKYYSKLTEVNFHLAQLHNLIGDHENAIVYARKALQQCQNDFIAVNSPDIPKSRMQIDQILLRNNSKEKALSSPKQQQHQLDQLARKHSLSQIAKKELPIHNNGKKSNEEVNNIQTESVEEQNGNELYYYEWNSSKLTNLIRCYEILAREEEHFLNFDESNRLYTKAVYIAQEHFGVENVESEQQLDKLISFQKRQTEFMRNKQQNMIQQFSHLSIKPLLQQHLDERVSKINTQINQQLLDKKANSLGNIFSVRKTSPSSILQTSPYNQRLIPYQQLKTNSNRMMRCGSSQSSKRNQVVVVRQKKLNLDTLPCNLKFNITNGTVPTQTSIISTSTATTKNQNPPERKCSFSNLSYREKKISNYDGDSKQLRSLDQSPSNQFLKGSQTARGADSPRKFNLIERNEKQNDNASFLNDVYSVYPPPRLRSGRDLFHTAKQRNQFVDSLNSEKIKLIIENQISSQQNSKLQMQTKFSNKIYQKYAIFASNSISSPTNSLLNSKSHLQNFVDQMKIKGTQVNQQLMNAQLKMHSPPSPLSQIFGDSRIKLQTTQNSPRKVLVYSEIKGAGMKQNYMNNNYMGDFTDRIEIQTSHLKKKSLSSHEQFDQHSKEQRKQIIKNQQEQIKQQLQNKLKIEEINNNINNCNNDHCSTTVTTPTHSNSIQTLPAQEKISEFQRKKSYSVVQRLNVEGSQQKYFVEKRDQGDLELLLIKKDCQLMLIDYNSKNETKDQLRQLDNEEQAKQAKFCQGSTRFLFNKTMMVVQIEFIEKTLNKQKCNQFTQTGKEEQNEQINQNGSEMAQNYLRHSLNVSDLFSLNLPINTNKRALLIKLCESLSSYLCIDFKSKQLLIQISNQSQNNNTKTNVFSFPKIIEFPQEDLSLHFVSKDCKSSMIYCQENGRSSSPMRERRSNSQVNQDKRPSIINTPNISSPKPPQSQEIPLQVKGSLQLNQINKQVVCSYFSKNNSKEQLNAQCEDVSEQQQKQNIQEIYCKNQEINQHQQNQQSQLNGKISELQTDQQGKASKIISINSNLNQKNIQEKQEDVINIPLCKQSQSTKLDSPTIKDVKSQNISPVIKRRQFLDNNLTSQDDTKMHYSERNDVLKSFESSKCVEESSEKRGISTGSVKFISYYQVPSSVDSSFNSNQNFQFDQSNALRNSSVNKDLKKSNLFNDQNKSKQ